MKKPNRIAKAFVEICYNAYTRAYKRLDTLPFRDARAKKSKATDRYMGMLCFCFKRKLIDRATYEKLDPLPW